MSGTTMVMDADNRVDILLAQGSHQVIGSLLHFWIGTLYSIQFDAIAVSTSINRGDTTST